jgi:hypothetical protein
MFEDDRDAEADEEYGHSPGARHESRKEMRRRAVRESLSGRSGGPSLGDHFRAEFGLSLRQLGVIGALLVLGGILLIHRFPHLLHGAAGPPRAAAPAQVQVRAVYDLADIVVTQPGAEATMRLFGLREPAAGCQRTRADQVLLRTITPGPAVVAFDPSGKTDTRGQLQGTVIRKMNLSVALLERGGALIDPEALRRSPSSGLFGRAERQGRRARVGLWSC